MFTFLQYSAYSGYLSPLMPSTRLVLASDLHIGYHNRKAELQRWVRLINEEKPDLVLFAGDLLDGAI